VETFAFIAQTIKDDPRLRLAAGIALLGAIVAAVLGFMGGNDELALMAGLFVVGFTILLTILVSVSQSRTKRPYRESEFLYDLGDPQVSQQAVGLAARTEDENARHNRLLVAQGGWNKLSDAQKQGAGWIWVGPGKPPVHRRSSCSRS
jgi:predicted lipid-binding transport protein (Tim44 family)